MLMRMGGSFLFRPPWASFFSSSPCTSSACSSCSSSSSLGCSTVHCFFWPFKPDSRSTNLSPLQPAFKLIKDLPGGGSSYVLCLESSGEGSCTCPVTWAPRLSSSSFPPSLPPGGVIQAEPLPLLCRFLRVAVCPPTPLCEASSPLEELIRDSLFLLLLWVLLCPPPHLRRLFFHT